MLHRILQFVSITVVALGAAACSTSPSRFYTLASTATPGDAPPARYAVMVGPVTVPGSVDRPELVVQIAPNRVEIDEFNRWASPLNDSIARAVAGDLAVLLGTSDVAAGPLAQFNHAYRVTIDVQRFESIPKESVLIDAVWAVRTTATGSTRSGRTVATEPVTGTGYDALAAAHSRALATVSADIAAAIQASAAASAEQPPKKGSRQR